MDEWPFWMLEENVKLVNEIMEEEDTNRKKEEEGQQKGMPDTSSMMKNASNMGNIGNNFSMPSM
jgi:hypothetical protein